MATKIHLGISPGTRVIGLAVIYKDELVEWKVKTYKEPWSKAKERTILSSIVNICDSYEVQTVSLKRIDPKRSSLQLNRLLDVIANLLEKKHIKVRIISLSDLDYGRNIESRCTKSNLSEKVVTKYPVLKRTFQKERNNRSEYYTKMFEAIAIAEQCSR